MLLSGNLDCITSHSPWASLHPSGHFSNGFFLAGPKGDENQPLWSSGFKFCLLFYTTTAHHRQHSYPSFLQNPSKEPGLHASTNFIMSRSLKWLRSLGQGSGPRQLLAFPEDPQRLHREMMSQVRPTQFFSEHCYSSNRVQRSQQMQIRMWQRVTIMKRWEKQQKMMCHDPSRGRPWACGQETRDWCPFPDKVDKNKPTGMTQVNTFVHRGCCQLMVWAF